MRMMALAHDSARIPDSRRIHPDGLPIFLSTVCIIARLVLAFSRNGGPRLAFQTWMYLWTISAPGGGVSSRQLPHYHPTSRPTFTL
jgi:hypothetical protein